jgi:hypothetical protein
MPVPLRTLVEDDPIAEDDRFVGNFLQEAGLPDTAVPGNDNIERNVGGAGVSQNMIGFCPLRNAAYERELSSLLHYPDPF